MLRTDTAGDDKIFMRTCEHQSEQAADNNAGDYSGAIIEPFTWRSFQPFLWRMLI